MLFADIEFVADNRVRNPLWRLLDGLVEADWAAAVAMPGPQVAVAERLPELVARQHPGC